MRISTRGNDLKNLDRFEFEFLMKDESRSGVLIVRLEDIH